jgi:hypothetical protein
VYDVRKLKAILLLGGAVLVIVFVANAALVLTTAMFPDWLPRQFFGVDFLADNRQRAREAAAQYRDGTVGDGDPVVVILGLSSASEGVALTQLADRVNHNTRFLGLSGAGRNMRDVARYAAPLLESDARPELVVFAINLFHLMDPLAGVQGLARNLQREGTFEDLGGAWLSKRRQDIKYAIDFGIDRARIFMFDQFDVRLKKGSDPWREILRMGLTQTTSEFQWQANVRRYGERGYYDGYAYGRSRQQVGILIDLVSKFVAREAEVVVVLMPEHSRLRARIPDVAMRTLTDPFRRELGEQAPAIIDLRDTIPDSGFLDISHMNNDGRTLFSPQLADAIAQQLVEVQR